MLTHAGRHVAGVERPGRNRSPPSGWQRRPAPTTTAVAGGQRRHHQRDEAEQRRLVRAGDRPSCRTASFIASVTWRDLVEWTRPSYLSAQAGVEEDARRPRHRPRRARRASTRRSWPGRRARRTRRRGPTRFSARIIEHLRAVVRRSSDPQPVAFAAASTALRMSLRLPRPGWPTGLPVAIEHRIAVAGIRPRLLAADIELRRAVDAGVACDRPSAVPARRCELRRLAALLPLLLAPSARGIRAALRGRPRARSRFRDSRRSRPRRRTGWCALTQTDAGLRSSRRCRGSG